MLFEDSKHLVEQLLLVQVVDLQSSVHLVDDRVFMHEPWELAHDCSHEVPVVGETNVNMVTLHDLVL